MKFMALIIEWRQEENKRKLLKETKKKTLTLLDTKFIEEMYNSRVQRIGKLINKIYTS